MTPAESAKLERYLGYRFSDKDLLAQALTHKSLSARNNERLEFLGDGILNFIVAESLFRKFPSASEGQLSRLRASLVKQKTLAEIAREKHLSDFLLMGTGELKSGGFNRDSILSDAVEALVGAIYLEQGFGPTQDILATWYGPRLTDLSLDHAEKDAKSRLQEWLQGQQLPLPLYELIEVAGEAHEQSFIVQLELSMLTDVIKATGSSRRQAEQKAAALALAELDRPERSAKDASAKDTADRDQASGDKV